MVEFSVLQHHENNSDLISFYSEHGEDCFIVSLSLVTKPIFLNRRNFHGYQEVDTVIFCNCAQWCVIKKLLSFMVHGSLLISL